MNKEFWTIMIEGKFLNSNFMRDDNENIVEAIRFYNEEDCRDFFEGLRRDRPFKMVKVKCKLEVINE